MDELEIWKKATWEFMLEHCEIMPRGKYFIKFHTDGQNDFERRVRGRIEGYHRENIVIKQQTAEAIKQEHLKKKKEKKEKYILGKEERIKVLKEVQKKNARIVRWNKFKNKVKSWLSL